MIENEGEKIFAKVTFYHSYVSSANLNSSQTKLEGLFLNPQIRKNIFFSQVFFLSLLETIIQNYEKTLE